MRKLLAICPRRSSPPPARPAPRTGRTRPTGASGAQGQRAFEVGAFERISLERLARRRRHRRRRRLGPRRGRRRGARAARDQGRERRSSRSAAAARRLVLGGNRGRVTVHVTVPGAQRRLDRRLGRHADRPGRGGRASPPRSAARATWRSPRCGSARPASRSPARAASAPPAPPSGRRLDRRLGRLSTLDRLETRRADVSLAGSGDVALQRHRDGRRLDHGLGRRQRRAAPARCTVTKIGLGRRPLRQLSRARSLTIKLLAPWS